MPIYVILILFKDNRHLYVDNHKSKFNFFLFNNKILILNLKINNGKFNHYLYIIPISIIFYMPKTFLIYLTNYFFSLIIFVL